MANDFTNAKAVGVTTQTTVYTAPVSKDSIILELDIANTTASAVTASAKLYDATDSAFAHIVKDAPIPVGGALQVISGQKVVLMAGDYLCVVSSGAVDVVCSILEDVNA
jgi:hypothetical protein